MSIHSRFCIAVIAQSQNHVRYLGLKLMAPYLAIRTGTYLSKKSASGREMRKSSSIFFRRYELYLCEGLWPLEIYFGSFIMWSEGIQDIGRLLCS